MEAGGGGCGKSKVKMAIWGKEWDRHGKARRKLSTPRGTARVVSKDKCLPSPHGAHGTRSVGEDGSVEAGGSANGHGRVSSQGDGHRCLQPEEARLGSSEAVNKSPRTWTVKEQERLQKLRSSPLGGGKGMRVVPSAPPPILCDYSVALPHEREVSGGAGFNHGCLCRCVPRSAWSLCMDLVAHAPLTVPPVQHLSNVYPHRRLCLNPAGL